jgi:hypothetical protein
LTEATSEPPSVPLSVTEYGVLRHPAGTVGVVFVGSAASSLTVCAFQPLRRPALSTMRVSRLWTPLPATRTS